eukprot:3643315-Rhodomonas_salina.1
MEVRVHSSRDFWIQGTIVGVVRGHNSKSELHTRVCTPAVLGIVTRVGNSFSVAWIVKDWHPGSYPGTAAARSCSSSTSASGNT